MTTTSTDDVASVLAARKSEIAAGPPATEYPSEVIPPANGQTGEIVPASTATTTPGGEGTPRPPVAPSAAVEPARPTDYSMIPAKVLGGIPYASEYARLAKTICNTEMVPMTMRGAWDKVMAAFMRGYEMGLGPMQSLDSFNVIEGKVGLKAEAMRALIMDAGHQIILEDVYGGEGGQQVVAIDASCHRADWPDEQWRSYRYSMQDATLAGLLKMPRSGNPGAWQKTPRAMMDARATSGAGRRYFADVLAGMSYTPEEIRDFDGPQEAAQQEVAPSPSAAVAASTGPSEEPPAAPQASPPPPPPPSAASAPAASSDAAPAPAAAADSMDGAAATSSPATSDSAPPTATTPPTKKASGSRKKAAGKSAAAPSAPAPAASTAPPAAPAPAATPTPSTESVTTPSNGEAGVLAAMRGALAEVIVGLPQAQQALCRAFLLRHWPEGAAQINTEAELQKAIDIAVGWPDSANQHPAPEEPGEEKWRGFSTGVYEVDREMIGRCDLCEWNLPMAATSANLPDFRKIELSAAACISHEQDTYADGTPYCPGRPTQQQLAADTTEAQ